MNRRTARMLVVLVPALGRLAVKVIRAKARRSPGGHTITQEEAGEIADQALEELRSLVVLEVLR